MILKLHLPYTGALCCISKQFVLLPRVIQGDLSVVWLTCTLKPDKEPQQGHNDDTCIART